MQRRLELSLGADSYTCGKFLNDLPFTVFNTCPVCVGGLVPVFVCMVSLALRLDYATRVTDASAMFINQMGLSYTVYYTAGCWLEDDDSGGLQISRSSFPGQTAPKHDASPPGMPPMTSDRCNPEHFEVAAGEFDAFTGSSLRVENVTNLHARRIDSLKVTPDWRFVIFIGAMANDIGNLYAVGAQQRGATQAVSLLDEKELDKLDEQCQKHSDMVYRAAKAAGASSARQQQHPSQAPVARVAGFKHLQVIIPGQLPFNEDVYVPPDVNASQTYRAAFAFECAEPSAMNSRGGPSGTPLRFSKLAIVDFQLMGALTGSKDFKARARSHLQLVDTTVVEPEGVRGDMRQLVHQLQSQACPRFVPSRMGAELMFVAEDPRPHLEERPTAAPAAWLPQTFMPSRWLALATVPQHGRPLEEKKHDGHVPTSTSSSVDATLLDVGEGGLPQAALLGCPEFVPSLYATTQSLTSRLSARLFKEKNHGARRGTEEHRFGDTFVILTDPSASASVLGVEAQEIAVSLAQEGRRGAVTRVHLLYNIDSLQPADGSKADALQLQLGGCQPIRAAGREGHNRLQWAVETMKSTLTATEAAEYVTWLACITADQRIAIVESANQENWINMSMPYPIWTGKSSQDIWCPRGREEACFEVWSNPNPYNFA